nr:unnamed protein product [Callosobruchus chinensis]
MVNNREFVVKLGQLNYRSLLSSFDAVVNVEKFDIFAVSETWLTLDITELFHCDRQSRGGR